MAVDFGALNAFLGIRESYQMPNALMSGYSKAVRQLTDMLGGTGQEDMGDLDAILSGRS